MNKGGSRAYHHSYDESYDVGGISPGDPSYVSLLKPNIQMRSNGLERTDSLTSVSSHSTMNSDANLTSAQLAANLKYLERQPEPRVQNEVSGVSEDTLRLLREQMATSLERLRELEEQVKTIPVLQVRISVLKEEKRLLMLQLKAKNQKLNQKTVGVGDGRIYPLKNTGFGDKDVFKDYRNVHERELATEQNEFTHEKEIHTLLLGKEDRIKKHQEKPPVKPKTRTIGTGDGDVFDRQSNVHVHEKELRTVIIGQEPDRKVRNVGILCKAPMRDVGVHFMSDLEKPLMKSIAVGVGEGALVGVTSDTTINYSSLNQMNLAAFQARNVNIDPAALRLLLDDMLKKELHSVATQTAAGTTEKGIQFEGVVEKVTVGCSNDTIDVIISSPKKNRSIAIDCRPTQINRSTLTEKIYRMDTATNTVRLQPIHRSTNTQPPVTYPANVGTEPIITRDAKTEVEAAILFSQNALRTQATNTDQPMKSECALNTEVTQLNQDLERNYQTYHVTTTTRSFGSGSSSSPKFERKVTSTRSSDGDLPRQDGGTKVNLTRHVKTTFVQDKPVHSSSHFEFQDGGRRRQSSPDEETESDSSPRRKFTVTETRVERVAKRGGEDNSDGIKGIMKKPGSNEGVNRKKEISFSEEVQGGYLTSSSEGDFDDPAEEDDETEEGERSEERDSDLSYDEAQYDGRSGRVSYSLQAARPPADQNMRDTYEISDQMTHACQVYATFLDDSTKITSKELNAAMNIIQSEWFKVSSHKLSNSGEVEDYLTSFKEISGDLLNHVVNMSDANGNTALHYAVSHCNMDIVSLLLDTESCDCDKQNKAGYTAIMLGSLAQAQSSEQNRILRRLFATGDVNAKASQAGQTALMLAVSHGRLDMVRLLLEANAGVNMQDDDGSTALMCASEHGHADIVRELLKHEDIDSTLQDNDGSTALSIALEAGHREVGLQLYAHVTFTKDVPAHERAKVIQSTEKYTMLRQKGSSDTFSEL